MMRGILAAALIAAVAGSCNDRPRHVVTLTFNDAADSVTVATSTRAGNGPGKPDTEEATRLRDALIAGRDEWSNRFANADPKSEQITFHKTEGVVDEVDHSASMPPDALQKFFYDTPLSVALLRGPGWAELTIYAGASTRATRQQKADAEKRLAAYAEKAKRYFEAVRGMYAYLDEKPQRAQSLWLALLRGGDQKTPGLVSDREDGLVRAVDAAAEALMDTDDERDALSLNQELDLVFNPFPAELHVVIPSEPLAYEGFTTNTTTAGSGLVVKTANALEAVNMLEGRWVSPDPLSVVLRNDKNSDDEATAASLAEQPRRAATVISADEISAALIEKMRPAPRYRVRWITKQPQ